MSHSLYLKYLAWEQIAHIGLGNTALKYWLINIRITGLYNKYISLIYSSYI